MTPEQYESRERAAVRAIQEERIALLDQWVAGEENALHKANGLGIALAILARHGLEA